MHQPKRVFPAPLHWLELPIYWAAVPCQKGVLSATSFIDALKVKVMSISLGKWKQLGMGSGAVLDRSIFLKMWAPKSNTTPVCFHNHVHVEVHL